MTWCYPLLWVEKDKRKTVQMNNGISIALIPILLYVSEIFFITIITSINRRNNLLFMRVYLT